MEQFSRIIKQMENQLRHLLSDTTVVPEPDIKFKLPVNLTTSEIIAKSYNKSLFI